MKSNKQITYEVEGNEEFKFPLYFSKPYQSNLNLRIAILDLIPLLFIQYFSC